MNEQNEIEQLKRERDEALSLLEEVIRPHGIYDTAVAKSGGAAMAEIYMETGDRIKAAIEALRPKPERLRCLVNQRQDGSIFAYQDPKRPFEGVKATRIAVPMIEVLPAPKWERWENIGGEIIEATSREHVSYAYSLEMARKICEAHNAEMERLAALWEGGADE